MIAEIKILYFKLYFFMVKYCYIFPSKTPSPSNYKDLKYIQRSNVGSCEKNKLKPIPKIIWSYWDSPEFPKLVKDCINNTRIQNPDFNYIIITPQNLCEYLPDFPNHLKFPSIPYKSDYIRLSLLKKYGGIWMDITTVLTDSLNWILELQKRHRFDFFAFHNPAMMTENKGYPLIESWFVAANSDSELIRDWWIEFDFVTKTDDPSCYYLGTKNFKDFSYNIPKQFHSYLIIHLSCQKILHSNKKYNYFLLSAKDEGMFYYYNSNSYRDYCMNLTVKSAVKKISKIIKLTGSDRREIDAFNKFGLMKKNSIFYKFNILTDQDKELTNRI